MSRLLKIITIILTVLYPFAIYYALQKQQIPGALVLLALILLLRIFAYNSKALGSNLLILIIGGVIILLTLLQNNQTYLLLYPSLVSYSLLLLFASSLFSQISIVERIASLRVAPEDRTLQFKNYCRQVTIAWCWFMFLNGSFATALALYASYEVWTLYTGLISYILMGLMFAGEYLIRKIVMRKSYCDVEKIQ